MTSPDDEQRTDTDTRDRLTRIQAGYEHWQRVSKRALIIATTLVIGQGAAFGVLFDRLEAGRAESRMLRAAGTEQVCQLARSVLMVASAAEQAGVDENFTGPLERSVTDCEQLLREYEQSPN